MLITACRGNFLLCVITTISNFVVSEILTKCEFEEKNENDYLYLHPCLPVDRLVDITKGIGYTFQMYQFVMLKNIQNN